MFIPPAERDLANGGQGAGDGGALTINGVQYDKGVGCHAYSAIEVQLGGAYERFSSCIGVDDNAPGSAGSVRFFVYGDGNLLYSSDVKTGADDAEEIAVDVTGVQVLKLEVTDAGDGKNNDHADWANTRLTTEPIGGTGDEPGGTVNPSAMLDSIRYAGEYYDAETGFIYLRNRYYDPEQRRFITEDPHWNIHNMIYGDDGNNGVPNVAAIMQSGNLFVYCGNNPILRIDPTGKTWRYFDMYLPQWAQDHLARLTNNYYSVGDSRNEYGGFVRDDIHNEAVAFRMQFLDSKYLGQAVKDLQRVGLSTNDPNYYQRVYEWAMALQETEKAAGPVPRNKNGDMNNYVFNALLGGVKADLKQFNDACRQLGISGNNKYDFQRYLEDYKSSRGMPAGQRLPYKELLEVGKEFLGQ